MKTLVWLILVLVLLVTAGSILWRFLARDDDQHFDRGSVRMEVLNGCGVPRAGRAVADELQSRGYDASNSGNALRRYRRTTVVDLRDPRGSNAGRVARSIKVQRRFLGMRLGRPVLPDTVADVDSSRFFDVGVVVGEDFRRFFPSAIPLH